MVFWKGSIVSPKNMLLRILILAPAYVHFYSCHNLSLLLQTISFIGFLSITNQGYDDLKKNFPELGKHSCPYFRHKIKTIKVLNQLNLSLDVNSSLQAYLMIKQKPDQRENREGEILCFWDTSRSLGRPSSYSCSSIGGGLKSPDYTDLQTNKTATYHLFI